MPHCDSYRIIGERVKIAWCHKQYASGSGRHVFGRETKELCTKNKKLHITRKLSGNGNWYRGLRNHQMRDIVNVDDNDACPYLSDSACKREHAFFNREAKHGSFFLFLWTKHSFQSDNVRYTRKGSERDAHSQCVRTLVNVADDTCYENSCRGVEHRGMWPQQLLNGEELKTKSENV